MGYFLVTDTAQVELRSDRVLSTCRLRGRDDAALVEAAADGLADVGVHAVLLREAVHLPGPQHAPLQHGAVVPGALQVLRGHQRAGAYTRPLLGFNVSAFCGIGGTCKGC